MKKKTLFIVLGIILIVIVGVSIIFSYLGREKEVVTANEFKTLMEDKGFYVSDATSQFSEYDYVRQVYAAVPSDYSYKIEFYEFSDDNYATSFYNNNKSIFE